jgi:hypothetical protein
MKGKFTGRLVNVNESGKLVVEREDGNINEYSFKEIDFI